VTFAKVPNTLVTFSKTRVARWLFFQTQNPNLGKYFRALDWKMLIYFMAFGNILRSFVKFHGHLEHFVLIWYIFSGFSKTYQEKSGNPE
jgi:hypothetical protein